MPLRPVFCASSVGRLIVFSLSNALLGACYSVTTTAGRTLTQRKFPARSIPAVGDFINGNVGGLFRHTLPRKRGSVSAVLSVHDVFIPCCGRRNARVAFPFRKVIRLLCALRQLNVGATITSGGCRRTAITLVRGFFPRVRFSTMLKRHSNVPMGPSPAVVRSVLHVTSMSPSGTLCVNSSRISVVATVGTNISTVNIA